MNITVDRLKSKQLNSTLLLPLVFATVAADAVAAPCDRASLFAKLKNVELAAAPPAWTGPSDERFARLVLIDSPLATDAFQYEAVIELATGRTWLLQFGGIAGEVRWLGPTQTDTGALQDCVEVKLATQGRSPGH